MKMNRRMTALGTLNKYLKDKNRLPKRDVSLEGASRTKARENYETFLKKEMEKLDERIRKEHGSFDMVEFLKG